MSRPARHDQAGAWHHVMNRGVARRTLFESRADVRTFLAALARIVRSGALEVHAFCVLTTHYHLLVRSPCGDLAHAMQRLQNEYARWFNRARRRDGPLFRGRYRSRTVTTETYRRLLVRYIDHNPVQAGLVGTPAQYPHGSARSYARRRGPPWLCRTWVESVTADISGSMEFEPAAYERTFAAPIDAQFVGLVERLIAAPASAADPLDDLLDAAPARVRDWMARKAELADGTAPGLPVCDEISVVRCLAPVSSLDISTAKQAVPGTVQIEVGLMRDLCGTTYGDIGRRVGVTPGGARNIYARHRDRLRDDANYASQVAEIAANALRLGHPARALPAGRTPLGTLTLAELS